MKYFYYFIVICISGALFFQACSKKGSKSEPAPLPINTICDGNGTTSFFPITKGNFWKYSYYMMNISQSISPTFTVGGTKTFNSKVYSIFSDPSGFLFLDDQYYRQDAATKNIYVYYVSPDKEFLEVPAAPTLNQSWTYLSYTRKVTSISASYKTSSCAYSGLLEITELDGTTMRRKMFYKKGIGMVGRQEPGILSGTDDMKLSEITLK